MNRIKDHLHLHLFDEVVVDVKLDDDDGTAGSASAGRGCSSDDVHKRLERKWLGSMTIPFASLYHNTRIEGTFRW